MCGAELRAGLLQAALGLSGRFLDAQRADTLGLAALMRNTPVMLSVLKIIELFAGKSVFLCCCFFVVPLLWDLQEGKCEVNAPTNCSMM